MIMSQQHYTLSRLNMMVRFAIERAMPDTYWVEAEISDLHEGNGHCYIDLVEKDGRGNTPVARASAKCWRSTWAVVRPHFERVTGQPLHRGMKVLLCVYAQFHENYGFSWIVTDIDPTYTLGDMARKRREIVAELKRQGVFTLNKELEIPLFAQRIAVISSPTAAGYGDFSRQLQNNGYGFAFHTELFEAVMQGERVEQSVISALDSINQRCDEFDCVVIIRGGGATSDMSGFDTLRLAENVANFPLPVITGIGHDRDESVLDMISCVRVKTPTAAAAFLVDRLKGVADILDNAYIRVVGCVTSAMDAEKARLASLSDRVPLLFGVIRLKQETLLARLAARSEVAVRRRLQLSAHHVDMLERQLKPSLQRIFINNSHRLDMLQQRLKALDPDILLARGYSITMHNGRAVTDATSLKAGDEIVTRLAKGEVKSVVE